MRSRRLRAHQARVLPRFAAAEDAARLAEVMSFALAACVVAERFAAVAGRATAPGWRPLTDDVPESAAVGAEPPPRPFRALLLARLAGEAGLGWLGQEPAALHALAAYFGDGPSELRAIAEEAERRIRLPLDRGPAASAPPAQEAAADRPHAPQPQAATAEPEPKRTPPPAIGGEGAGWEWINWVRAGLRDGSVAVNAAGAWLHNIEGEAYAVSPACFEALADGRDIAPGTIRNRVVRLGRHRQRASSSGSANVFRAVLADGSRVKAWCSPGSSSGTTIHRRVRTPRWSTKAGDRPEAGRGFAPSPRAACGPWRTPPALTQPCGDRAPTRPRNRREAGGAPAIGIEARKGRDPAPPGLGAKHESPGPTGHRPSLPDAPMWSKTDPQRCEFESRAAAPWTFACRKCSARTGRRAARRAGGSGPLPVRWSPSSISRDRTAFRSPADRLHFLAQRLACHGREAERRASDGGNHEQ